MAIAIAIAITIVEIRYRNYTHYTLYRIWLPIYRIAIVRLLSFLFLDDFKENANISVAIKSSSTVSLIMGRNISIWRCNPFKEWRSTSPPERPSSYKSVSIYKDHHTVSIHCNVTMAKFHDVTTPTENLAAFIYAISFESLFSLNIFLHYVSNFSVSASSSPSAGASPSRM